MRRPHARKNRLLATAFLAGFAGMAPAGAASSVTLYGIADTGYGWTQYGYGTGSTRHSLQTSGMRDGGREDSRVGFKGSEELGYGLRATFQFEAGLHPSDGAQSSGASFFNRIATIGLASERWGAFTLGRQRGVSEKFFPHFNTYEGLGKMERAFGAYKIRRDGLFRYLSPDWAGFRLGLGWAPNGTLANRANPGSNSRDNYVTSGIGYTRGPWHVAATYDQQQALDGSGQRLGYAVKDWAVGGSYDFGILRLDAAYGQDRNGKLNAAGGVGSGTLGGTAPAGLGAYNRRGFRSNNVFVSVVAPIGPGTLGLTWSHSTSNLADLSGGALAGAAQHIYSAVYTYALSKRTALYTYGAYGNGLAYLGGLSGKELGAGLIHRF